MIRAASQHPAGGKGASSKVGLGLNPNYIPEEHGLKRVQLSPFTSIYQLADPDQLLLLRDGRLHPAVTAEMDELDRYDPAPLNFYLSEVNEVETWISTRAFPSIAALLELAETAYFRPAQLDVVFRKHVARMGNYTPLTKRKISSLNTWRAATDMNAGLVTAIDILDSLADIPKEIEQNYATLETLNTRFRELFKSGQPDGMHPILFRKLQAALIDGRGLIHDIKGLEQPIMGFIPLLQMVVEQSQIRFHEQVVMDPLKAGNVVKELCTTLERLRRFTYARTDLAFDLAQTLMKERAGTRGVRVIGEEIAYIQIPEVARFSIFRANLELLINAIKYSDPDKPVEQMAQERGLDVSDVRHVKVWTEEEGTLLHTFFQDNGVGMEHPERAFEPDVRLRPDLADGSGNGLPGIRSIARSLGGDLTATSTPGVGTTMKFTIDMKMWRNRGGSGGGSTGNGGYGEEVNPSVGLGSQHSFMGSPTLTPKAGLPPSLLGARHIFSTNTTGLGVPFLPHLAKGLVLR
ncbi:MAG: sensor histidine kinase [Deltaproteobacteria bacterium]|nr:sensor histidine kinase [Deltaproteobacteria bacterium]